MTVVIKEWWLDDDIELDGRVQPPVGPGIRSVKCCVDLTCAVDRTGRIVVQRFTLARGMKRDRYNISCPKAGKWLADQHDEMTVNKYLKAHGNEVLDAQPRLSQEVMRRRVDEGVDMEAASQPKKKSGGIAATLFIGIFKILWWGVKLVFSLIGRLFGKK